MKNIFWKILHWVIIINFLLEIAYGFIMIFFVVGGGGPLFGGAKEISHEVMLARRLYALETWIAIAGLSIYLAVVEYLPQKLEVLLSKKSGN